MQAPDFWYQPRGWKAALLSPAGLAYRIGGILHRLAASPYKSNIPVICIGNVVAGGAGKTPTALAVAHILQRQSAKPVFVTRGYGGLETGPLKVDPERHNARDVGDEALILACAAACWIGADRAATLRAAAESSPTHIIMDDGLQNPHVAPDISLLVIDGYTGLGNGCVMPAGPLREPLEDALKRAAAVVMIGQEWHDLTQRINKPILRARLVPRLPEDFDLKKPCLAFAGIGRPEKFFASCREAGLTLAATRSFPDHYLFTESDLQSIAAQAEANQWRLITTAKDWVRLPDLYRKKITVLPVELLFEDVEAVRKILPPLI